MALLFRLAGRFRPPRPQSLRRYYNPAAEDCGSVGVGLSMCATTMSIALPTRRSDRLRLGSCNRRSSPSDQSLRFTSILRNMSIDLVIALRLRCA